MSDPKHGKKEPGIDEIVHGIEERMIVHKPWTPEQGCLGCGLGIGLLVISILAWMFLYWYYNPEFHQHPHPLPLPAIFDASPTPHSKRVHSPTPPSSQVKGGEIKPL